MSRTPPRVLLFGAEGQVGWQLQRALSPLGTVTALDRRACDLTDLAAVRRQIATLAPAIIVNAAAYTAVDAAETPEGRKLAWSINVDAVRNLVAAARAHEATLVHVSSDYVFDGKAEQHTEDEPFSPLGVYGVTKAAGDALVATWPRHYLVRTSWVIGEGRNFVRTMASLAEKGVKPAVVDDQFGRLTFTTDLAAGIAHLLATGAPYGTYNLTGDGAVRSWLEVARQVYTLTGHAASDVSGQSTEDYAAGKVVSPRPRHSALALDKIKATGFVPRDADEALCEYLA